MFKPAESISICRICQSPVFQVKRRQTMKKVIIIGVSAIALAAIAQFVQGGATMKITSSAFQEGGTIPDKFSRSAQNVNPPLRIEGAPAEAKSLLLIMEDLGAPVGLFTHCLVWKIDPM